MHLLIQTVDRLAALSAVLATDMNMRVIALSVALGVFFLAGCATTSDSYAVQEAKRIGVAKRAMWDTYNSCLSNVWTNAQYKDFWMHTAELNNDSRRVSLLTDNEKLSKNYKDALPLVASDLA